MKYYTAKSLAGSGKEYIICQVRPYDDGDVHLQILIQNPNPTVANRDYGLAWTLHAPELADRLQAILADSSDE